MTGKIALEGLEFHAYHGVYPHERESGNFFEVDISVDTDFTSAAIHDDLEGTVNYETLFRIVKDQMDIPSKLLETVARNIVEEIFKSCPTVERVSIRIAKLNPPIGGKCRSSSVSVSVARGY